MEKKGLLIIKSSVDLSSEQHEQIQKHLDPLGEKLGLSIVVVSDPMDATVYYDPTPMVEALKEATKALNAAADRLNVHESSDQVETVNLHSAPGVQLKVTASKAEGWNPVAQPRGLTR